MGGVFDVVNYDMDYFGNGENLRSVKNNRFFYFCLV